MLTSLRKRLLYCSSVAPQRTGAGELLVHRHLTRLADWDVMVVTPPERPADPDFERRLSVPWSPMLRLVGLLRRGAWWKVVDRAAGRRLVSGFARAADEFRPDIVVSVLLPDAYLTAASVYARHADIPLAIFCHDDYEDYPLPGMGGYLGAIYRQAGVRFCVSEVMAREFVRRYGVSGTVLYPIPERNPGAICPQSEGAPLVVGYAGSLGDGCEVAMVALADALAARGGRLVIASRTPHTVASKIWRHPAVVLLGALAPNEVLSRLLAAGVNVLSVVQSFDPADRVIQFNFPSKLTEYMTFGLPILVVAPDYASVPLWLAEEPGAAVLVMRPETEAFAEPLARLSRAEERLSLARATAVAASRYSPGHLRALFEDGLRLAMAAQVPS